MGSHGLAELPCRLLQGHRQACRVGLRGKEKESKDSYPPAALLLVLGSCMQEIETVAVPIESVPVSPPINALPLPLVCRSLQVS